MRQASFSNVLFDQMDRRVTEEENTERNAVTLAREPSETQTAFLISSYGGGRFDSRTIYSVSMLLIATVIAWAIIDARVRIARLEHAVRYLYYSGGGSR